MDGVYAVYTNYDDYEERIEEIFFDEASAQRYADSRIKRWSRREVVPFAFGPSGPWHYKVQILPAEQDWDQHWGTKAEAIDVDCSPWNPGLYIPDDTILYAPAAYVYVKAMTPAQAEELGIAEFRRLVAKGAIFEGVYKAEGRRFRLTLSENDLWDAEEVTEKV